MRFTSTVRLAVVEVPAVAREKAESKSEAVTVNEGTMKVLASSGSVPSPVQRRVEPTTTTRRNLQGGWRGANFTQKRRSRAC